MFKSLSPRHRFAFFGFLLALGALFLLMKSRSTTPLAVATQPEPSIIAQKSGSATAKTSPKSLSETSRLPRKCPNTTNLPNAKPKSFSTREPNAPLLVSIPITKRRELTFAADATPRFTNRMPSLKAIVDGPVSTRKSKGRSNAIGMPTGTELKLFAKTVTDILGTSSLAKV